VGLRGVACDRRPGAVLPVFVLSQGLRAVMAGEFATAASLIAEADVIAEATETGIAPYASLTLGALRGREAEISELITSTNTNAVAEGQGLGAQGVQWAAAILHNGLGRYDEALAAAQQASEIIPSCISRPGPWPS
jgi:uncharacterized caspase-like protein